MQLTSCLESMAKVRWGYVKGGVRNGGGYLNVVDIVEGEAFIYARRVEPLG